MLNNTSLNTHQYQPPVAGCTLHSREGCGDLAAPVVKLQPEVELWRCVALLRAWQVVVFKAESTYDTGCQKREWFVAFLKLS